jgi:hypothetical protein
VVFTACLFFFFFFTLPAFLSLFYKVGQTAPPLFGVGRSGRQEQPGSVWLVSLWHIAQQSTDTLGLRSIELYCCIVAEIWHLCIPARSEIMFWEGAKKQHQKNSRRRDGGKVVDNLQKRCVHQQTTELRFR